MFLGVSVAENFGEGGYLTGGQGDQWHFLGSWVEHDPWARLHFSTADDIRDLVYHFVSFSGIGAYGLEVVEETGCGGDHPCPL